MPSKHPLIELTAVAHCPQICSQTSHLFVCVNALIKSQSTTIQFDMLEVIYPLRILDLSWMLKGINKP